MPEFQSLPDATVVLTTVGNIDQAGALARDLVSRRLAACVTALPSARSVFVWKGIVQEEDEVLLLIKTPTERLPELEQHLRERHPYDLPEFLALPVAHGSDPYLAWLRNATRSGTTEEG